MKPVICILGPTASGKTALALRLAEHLPCRLISVDSAQIYRGMDIGTAKLSPEEQRHFPHALIDILEPEEPYSAARFVREATAEIEAAHAAGQLPVLVGGSMLYFYALFSGLSELPAGSAALRQEIEAAIAAYGLDAWHRQLLQLDPLLQKTLKAADRQRIVRFVELWMLTGETPSQLFARQKAARPPWRVLSYALLPAREELHRRIAVRFQEMMAAGFLAEVAQLKARPQLNLSCPAMRAVGYRQLWEYLEGHGSLDEAVTRGIIATRQMAKRQITWMNNRLRQTLSLTPAPATPAECLTAIRAFVEA